jgi:hypothetical protein
MYGISYYEFLRNSMEVYNNYNAYVLVCACWQNLNKLMSVGMWNIYITVPSDNRYAGSV